MADDTVVPKVEPVEEGRFHATFLQSLSRLIAHHGEGKVALWLGVSVRQLRNIKAGSLPTADKIWNLLPHDQTAHDELDRLFGVKKVPHDAHCSSDPVSARIAALLTKAIEAESPDSPGGMAVILHEILGMDEPTLRQVYHCLGGWIAQIDRAREPSLRMVSR